MCPAFLLWCLLQTVPPDANLNQNTSVSVWACRGAVGVACAEAPGTPDRVYRGDVPDRRQHDDDSDRVSIPLDPETALRALLRVDPKAEPVEPGQPDDDDDKESGR